jgi:hypothetical protein
MSYYALILDSDYSSNEPQLPVIEWSSDEAALENVEAWDPTHGYPKIDRSAFKIRRLKQHNIKNPSSGTKDAAHICRVTM